jgi:hypothetical protein
MGGSSTWLTSTTRLPFDVNAQAPVLNPDPVPDQLAEIRGEGGVGDRLARDVHHEMQVRAFGVAADAQRGVVDIAALLDEKPKHAIIARIIELDVVLEGEVRRQVLYVRPEGHAARGGRSRELTDVAGGLEEHGAAADAPMWGRLVAGHIGEVVVEEGLLAGNEVVLDELQVRLGAAAGGTRRSRRGNRRGRGRGGGRGCTARGQRDVAARLDPDRDAAARFEPHVRPLRRDFDEQNRSHRAGRGADERAFTASGDAADCRAEQAAAGRFQDAVALAHDAAFFVDVHLPLGVGHRLDLRGDRDRLTGVLPGFEGEAEDGVAGHLTAGFGIGDLALDGVACVPRRHHAGENAISLMAGLRSERAHELHLKVDLLGVGGAGEQQRERQPSCGQFHAPHRNA